MLIKKSSAFLASLSEVDLEKPVKNLDGEYCMS